MKRLTVKQVREYLWRTGRSSCPSAASSSTATTCRCHRRPASPRTAGPQVGERTGTLVAPVIGFILLGRGAAGHDQRLPRGHVPAGAGRPGLPGAAGLPPSCTWCWPTGQREPGRALGDALKILLRTNPPFEQVLIAPVPGLEVRRAGDRLAQGLRRGRLARRLAGDLADAGPGPRAGAAGASWNWTLRRCWSCRSPTRTTTSTPRRSWTTPWSCRASPSARTSGSG